MPRPANEHWRFPAPRQGRLVRVSRCHETAPLRLFTHFWRAFRHIAKTAQGTRGETGERWCERAWTAVMTCRKQGRSAFEFFRDALRAYTNDAPAPSLLKNP